MSIRREEGHSSSEHVDSVGHFNSVGKKMEKWFRKIPSMVYHHYTQYNGTFVQEKYQK